MFKKVSAALLFCALSFATDALSSNAAETLSLSQAEALALRQNRDVVAAQLEVKKAEADLKSVATTRFPKLLAVAFAGQQVTENRGTSIYPENIAVLPGVLQPVTQQYRIGLQIEQAKIRVSVAKENLRLVKQRAVATAKRLYLSMLAVQSATAGFERNYSFLGELERYVQFEVEKGSALPVDLLLVQARVARADFEVERSSDDLNTLGQTLNRLLGRPPLAEIELIEDTSEPLAAPNAEATISGALRNRPEVAQLKLDIIQQHLQSKIEMSRYIPDISIGALGSFTRNLSPTLPQSLTSIGFAGVWEPWDWGRRFQLGKEAQIAMTQSKVKLLDVSDSVAISADKARRELRVAIKQLRAAELGQSSTQEQLRVVGRRFKVGAALLKDVLEAEAAHSTAIAENVKAKSDYARARVDLDEAIGRDY